VLTRADNAERRRRHQQDRAEAARIGQDLGLGEVTAIALYRHWRLWMTVTGVCLVIGGPFLALAIAPVSAFTAATRVIIAAVCAGAALLGWRLMRMGVRTRAVDRLLRYSGGLVQLIHDEPGPRVIRWAEVDSVTPYFSSDTESNITGLYGIVLRGSTGSVIKVFAGYRQPAVRELAADADRALAARFVPELIGAYDRGETVVAGRWRIDRAGLTRIRESGRATAIPWADIRAITIPGASVEPPSAIKIGLDSNWRFPAIGLSAVPNGIFIPRLIEHAAGQHGVPVNPPGPGLAARA